MSKKLLFVLSSFAFIIFYSSVQSNAARNLITFTDHQFFIENKGQWPQEVKYLCKTNGMNAWITDRGVVYDYYQIIRDENAVAKQDNLIDGHSPTGLVHERREEENTRIKGHVVRALLQGANARTARTNAIAKGQRDGYYNYFIGNDPAAWASFVRFYDTIEVQGAYPGIDIRYYFDGGRLRYDYQVTVGANPSQIRFNLEGANDYQVDADGELLISTSLGEVRHGKLRAYQQTNGKDHEVTCRFESLPGRVIGIKAVGYDKEKPLIIDPLVYSTFIGGSSAEQGNSIAVDNSGNAYVTGNTPSANYPTTVGAYDVSQNGNTDVFVTKLDANGSTLVYSAFVGGSGLDFGNAVAVDGNGNAYLTGYTGSSNYPTTSGAYSQSLNGYNYDAFVTKLNPSGSALIFSTYLGGTNTDNGIAIALENVFGNIFIAGETFSSDFPTTSNAFDKTYNGGDDIFVTKLNTSGTGLVFSTYLGGKSYDVVHSMAADVNGYPCVVGETTSTDFPLQSSYIKNSTDGLYNDVFVAKLNHGGAGLMFSTYLGGSSHDYANSVAFDANRNVYVTGCTYSSDFPTTAGAYSQTYHNYEAFITKINYTGASIDYSTFIGGTGTDVGSSILTDASGNAYITGRTTSTDYPTTSDAYDRSFNGGDWDAFVTKLNASGSALSYSTVIGGSSVDDGKSIALDASGNGYITGYTTSSNFPTTSGAYDQSYNGNNSDVFVIKLGLAVPDIASNYTSYSFGSVNVGSYKDYTFIILNNGNADLVVSATTITGVSGVTGSEFIITSGGAPFTIAGGATHDLVVRFAPNSAGNKTARLSIESNDPDENPFLITMVSNGTAPDIASSPNSWSFGSVTLGSYSDKTFVIKNEGNADLSVTATTLAGSYPGEYSIQSGGGSFTLATAATRDLVVRFQPTKVGIDLNAMLNISSNDPDENPFQITLAGSGTAAPKLLVNPISLDFGTTTNSMTFQISNTGGPTLNWTVAETPDKPWITSVTPAGGSDNVTITVTVDRSQLSDISDTGTLAVTSNGGNQNVTITIAKTSAPHFTFTPTDESYSIVVSAATLDGVPLEAGDEIGIFTPAGLCVGASVWTGNVPLAMTAWKDDAQTSITDGYKDGEAISFRVWDASSGLNADYPATATYTTGNGTFGNGLYSIISKLEATTEVQHTIKLKQGWSWISTNVTPTNPAVDQIFSQTAHLAILINSAGQFYVPGLINSIGNWQVLQGYKTYVNANDSATFKGHRVASTTPIPLNAGWNFVSYLPENPIAIVTALASIVSKLAIVKQNDGKFYIPGLINAIDNLKKGEGYKLYVNSACILTYPASVEMAKKAQISKVAATDSVVHFSYRTDTGENYSIVIDSSIINNQPLMANSEIGVFTPDGICVGAVVWTGEKPLSLIAWGDDSQTPAKDGYAASDEMSFRIWNANDKNVYAAAAQYSYGSNKFGEASYSRISLLQASTIIEAVETTIAQPTALKLLQNYPNPFNPSTWISFTVPRLSNIKLEIYDLLGRKVRTLTKVQFSAGSHEIEWNGLDDDGKSVGSGIYIFVLSDGALSISKKMIKLE
jgi:hypothetical protein